MVAAVWQIVSSTPSIFLPKLMIVNWTCATYVSSVEFSTHLWLLVHSWEGVFLSHLHSPFFHILKCLYYCSVLEMSCVWCISSGGDICGVLCMHHQPGSSLKPRKKCFSRKSPSILWLHWSSFLFQQGYIAIIVDTKIKPLYSPLFKNYFWKGNKYQRNIIIRSMVTPY